MNYEYLEHHGILGQKWGVRRYQNADGSYTAEGAKRRKYEKAQTKIESASATVGFKRAKQLAKSGDNKSKKAAAKIYSNAMRDYRYANSRNAKWNTADDNKTKLQLKSMEDAKKQADKYFEKNDPISKYLLGGYDYKTTKTGKDVVNEILKSGTIDKRTPWDEKPHNENQPWDEKLPDLKEINRHGNI